MSETQADSQSGGPIRRLEPCPASPNCVSSESTLPRQSVDPFLFTDADPDQAVQALRRALAEFDLGVITSDDGVHLKVEFKTRFFRFVDDLDFLIDPDLKIIKVRSAARIGFYDFGKNRRRLEQIRAAFNRRLAEVKNHDLP